MTAADVFGQHQGTEINPEDAATKLGDLLGFFHGEAFGGNEGISSGIGNTTATSTTSSSQKSQTSQGNGTDTASPVPQGTAVSQGYHGNEGGHPGVDLAVPVNTQILAATSGTVSHAANDDPGGYGEWVEITAPNGIVSRYGHLHGMSVQQGQQISAGQVIGTSGGEAGGPTSGNSEGPHLHFEVRTQGHTIDPTPFLAGGYQILGGSGAPTSTGVTTSPDPEALAAVQLQNVVNVLSGKPPQDTTQPADTTTPTTTGGTGDTDPGAVDAFLNATKQHESGGDYKIYNQSGQSNASGAYQFIGSTWRGEGGSTANAAEASPQEQDAIARKMAMRLFNQFKSWRLVAAAWYGGPAVAEQMASGQDAGSPQGQGSYKAYADTIQRMMSGGK